MTDRPRRCPWENRATHQRNRQIQVDGWRPIVFGYCPQADDCASCAGTGFKPNIEIWVGKEFNFVPCPFCLPAEYKKRVERLKPKLPK